MKKIITYIFLPLAIIGLTYLCYASIAVPIAFEKERSARESVCVDRLKDIRTLQIAYKSVHSKFANDLDSLILFYKNDSISVVKQVGSWDDSLAVAQKRVYRDTIKISVRDTLLKATGSRVDSLMYIPFSGGKKMQMQAVIAKVSGVDVPLFEAAAPFDLLLQGMDRQLIVNLNADRTATKRYEGLKVGNVAAPNNNAGNWE